MDRLRRSLRESFRRKPKSRSADSAPSELTPASTSGTNSSERNPAWHVVEDEVRSGRCQFDVKYLGAIEVFESRGMDVCENAMKVMRTQRRRVIKGVLYVSGDGLRVVDSEDNHGLLVDQTIEKVSFCSPDRNHPKGFAYICRDGTTRRWMCHGFHAAKDSGERLSHAVGCAFAICLEKKRKREAASFDGTTAKESTENAGTVNGGFANCRNNKAYSSFNRQLTISERLQDPQSAIVNEAPPSASTSLSEDRVLPRPLGNRSLFERQGSFKAPEQASSAVSFRRQFSLRTEGQTKPSFNGLSQIRNEPIIEGEELWPEASLISQFATLPTSSSFQSTLAPTPNQPDVATQKFSASSAFQNDGWQGTPVKRLNQSSTAVPPNTSSTSSAPVDWNLCLNSPAKGVKADDWLEQMLRNTSAASMSLPMVPEKKGVGSGPPPAHPPPPLPPTAEKLAAVLGSSPPSVADPFAKGYQRLRNSAEISFSEDLNAPTVAKVGDSTNSIEYSLLNESVNNSAASTALDLTTSCGATDLFGQPVFSPVPHTASTTPSHLSNGVVRSTNTSASSGVAPSDDPFDVKWSTLAISSTATKSTNPFANTLTAAR
uniref:PID domain-containing protein n=1 Tax=Steinernema glaseri TaxID=37863 RepID=A0A1I7Z3F0_9BILA